MAAVKLRGSMENFKLAAAIIAAFSFGVIITLLGNHMFSKKKRSLPAEQKAPCSNRQKLKTMDLILILIGVFLAAFTVYMIVLFREYGMIPDTLVTCVFAALAGECGIMGWIKTSKERSKERKWEKEDREYYDRPQDQNTED